jgi:uncharacterized protein YqgC (DUF456 family)
MDTTTLLFIFAALLVIVGLAGLLLPVLPGAPLLLAGLVVAAWAEDFAYVGAGTIAFLTFLAALSYVADFVAGALGAKKFGASTRAVIGATVGALVGLLFGLPGVLLGPFFGAVIGELSVRRDLTAAGRAGFGATLGLLLAVAAKMALAIAMIGTFVLMRFVAV